jgi:hypothetical protein
VLVATRAPEFLVVRDIYLQFQFIVGACEIRKTEVGGGEGRGLELIPNWELFLKSHNRTQLQCGTTKQRFDHFDIRQSRFLLSKLHYTGPSCALLRLFYFTFKIKMQTHPRVFVVCRLCCAGGCSTPGTGVNVAM